MKQKNDINAEKFAALMVEKIESLSNDWSKPWFYKANSKRNFFPQNITGRHYSGGNAFMLLLLCEKYNYSTPIFLTFKQAKDSGISILKGASSFPIYYPLFYAYHKKTKKRILLDEYKKLSDEEKTSFQLVAYNQYYNVFNLDQTNFSDIFPEKWDELFSRFVVSQNNQDTNLVFSNLHLERMLANQNWVCPIHQKYGDKAYYSISNDSIVIPHLDQFKNSESRYSTLLHEMSHSCGVKSRLNRKNFYDSSTQSYGREELVAELSEALTGLVLGVSSSIREENAAYLKSWCKSIKEEPKFIFSVLSESVKCMNYICSHLNLSVASDISLSEPLLASAS